MFVSWTSTFTRSLWNFVSITIVLLADIEKPFLQVGSQEPDRDVTRFLWFKDVNDVKE